MAAKTTNAVKARKAAARGATKAKPAKGRRTARASREWEGGSGVTLGNIVFADGTPPSAPATPTTILVWIVDSTGATLGMSTFSFTGSGQQAFANVAPGASGVYVMITGPAAPSYSCQATTVRVQPGGPYFVPDSGDGAVNLNVSPNANMLNGFDLSLTGSGSS